MYKSFISQQAKTRFPIVTIKWLYDKLCSGTNNVRILDASWHLPNTGRLGREDYEKEHITSAQFFDIEECSQSDDQTQHMLPTKTQFEQYVGKLGINNKTHVVVYDNNEKFGIFSAQRVWWTFRVFGHDESLISVVQGGMPKWKSEYPDKIDQNVENVPTEVYNATYRPELVKTLEQVKDILKNTEVEQICDARPPGRFQGTAPEPREGVKSGSMPGAINLTFFTVLNNDTREFKSKEEIESLFKEKGVDFNKPLSITCGSGISACTLALAAYVAGKEDVAVYDGSWIEWFYRAPDDLKQNVPE